MLKALLIDDEEPSRFHLRELLAAHPEIEIAGEAPDLAAARKLIAQTPFDFLFLDVKLGPDSGFELLPDLPPHTPVIFVTGYEEHAHRAFEVKALDYLVKPVRPSRLAESLVRLAQQQRHKTISLQPEPPEAPATYRLRPQNTVVLNSGHHAELTLVSDISLITAQQNYCFVHCANGRQTLVRRTLKSWATSLPTDLFVRVHRTMLVNLAQVLGYERRSARHISLRLAGVAQSVVVSRHATPTVKARLQDRFHGRMVHVA